MISGAQRGAIKLAFRTLNSNSNSEFLKRELRVARMLDAAKRGIKSWIACLGEQTFRSPVQMRGSRNRESRASATSAFTHHSVVAGVRQVVCRVIRATKAVVVKAAVGET